jgi:hypothetical protein
MKFPDKNLAIQMPFSANPPIKTYQYIAFVLGAAEVSCTRNQYNALLANYFIQVESAPNFSPQDHLIRFVPFLGPTTLSRHKLGTQLPFTPINAGEFIDAIGVALRNGFYVRILVDEFFIPEHWTFKTLHKIHDVLLTGINLASDIVHLVGYCLDNKFRASTCSVQQLCDAFFAIPKDPPLPRFIAFKFEPERLAIDTVSILSSMIAFLDSKATMETQLVDPIHPGKDDVRRYGVSVFDFLAEYINIHPEKIPLDRRPFSLIADYFLLMRARRSSLCASVPSFRDTGSDEEYDEIHREVRRMVLLSCASPNRLTRDHLNALSVACTNLRCFAVRSTEKLIDGIR